MFGFSKGKQSQIKFYAQMSDGDVLQATNNPPTVGETFGTSVYNTTGTMLPASWAVIDDHLLYADGTGYPRIFSGETEYVSNFIVYKGAAAIPDVPKKWATITPLKLQTEHQLPWLFLIRWTRLQIMTVSLSEPKHPPTH
jgi:hypothetical protein